MGKKVSKYVFRVVLVRDLKKRIVRVWVDMDIKGYFIKFLGRNEE